MLVRACRGVTWSVVHGRVGRAHCCARPPSEPDLRLSPHPAQASTEGPLAGRSAVPVPSPTCRRWHWAWIETEFGLHSSNVASAQPVRGTEVDQRRHRRARLGESGVLCAHQPFFPDSICTVWEKCWQIHLHTPEGPHIGAINRTTTGHIPVSYT